MGSSTTNWAYSRTTPPAVTDRRTIFPSRGFTPIEGGKLQNVRRERTITYSDGDKHVATSLLFRTILSLLSLAAQYVATTSRLSLQAGLRIRVRALDAP